MGLSGDVEPQAWSLIDTRHPTPRFNPVFSQIGANELCILGGFDCDYGVMFSDGVILNV